MKPEDMLPPGTFLQNENIEFHSTFFSLEEQEKRKDEFEKHVQMILKSEEEKGMEMARRMKTKPTKQGLVDNEAHCSALIENLVNKKRK